MTTLKPVREFLLKRKKLFVVVGMIVGSSYVGAVAASAMITRLLMNLAFPIEGTTRASASTPEINVNLPLSNPINYHDLRKAIEERNLFNSEGAFPDEEEVSIDAETKKEEVKEFDLSAPCNKSTLKIALVGTIYMGETNSVATVQEKGYTEADIYKVGDTIIGEENAKVARIERKRLIINNGGVKECFELEEKTSTQGGFSEPDAGPQEDMPVAEGGDAAQPPPADAEDVGAKDCSLEEAFVQEQLGPGFGNIITKARLVPNTQDNQVNGFKIFAIDSKSLFAKAGLKNGDVITQVNDVSLKQPEQGFALYQAFQDETEVRINVLRKGKTPVMITCRIK